MKTFLVLNVTLVLSWTLFAETKLGARLLEEHVWISLCLWLLTTMPIVVYGMMAVDRPRIFTVLRAAWRRINGERRNTLIDNEE